jgi:signal transduction histidine kinase
MARRTVRFRLTVLYGSLFLVAGAGLLAITYLLVLQSTGDYLFVRGTNSTLVLAQGHSTPRKGPSAAQGATAHRTDVTPAQAQAQIDRLLAQAAQQHTGSRKGPSAYLSSPDGTVHPTDATLAQAKAQIDRLMAQVSQQHDDELHQLLLMSGIALAIMAVVSIGLGWFVAGRALRPLRTITAAARDISASNLHERLALDGPEDEVKELGDTFDGLLGRLEGSFEAQRRFVANASHELRTPLTRQRTLVEVALGDPEATVDSLRASYGRVLTAVEQQERLIEALLTLARSERGLERREPFDLANLTGEVLLARRSEVERRGLHLQAKLEHATTSGDRRLVERLVANLVDNAARHNVPDGHVKVVAGTKAGRVHLSVANTGPKIPPAEVDRLFQPFRRLGVDRTAQRDGLGLGLSIVQAIATAHGATISAQAQPEGGLAIEVAFPAAATNDPLHEAAASYPYSIDEGNRIAAGSGHGRGRRASPETGEL